MSGPRFHLREILLATAVATALFAPFLSRESPAPPNEDRSRAAVVEVDWVPWIGWLAAVVYLGWLCDRAYAQWEAHRPRLPEPPPDPGPFKRGGFRAPISPPPRRTGRVEPCAPHA